jgi:hypothetical protein
MAGVISLDIRAFCFFIELLQQEHLNKTLRKPELQKIQHEATQYIKRIGSTTLERHHGISLLSAVWQ